MKHINELSESNCVDGSIGVGLMIVDYLAKGFASTLNLTVDMRQTDLLPQESEEQYFTCGKHMTVASAKVLERPGAGGDGQFRFGLRLLIPKP